MDVSIVIVNWNTAGHLRAAIASCYRHHGDLSVEVIVVDNGSSDDSVAMVRREFPDAVVIANDDNVGYVRAGNQGIAAATGRYILMLNSDAELTEGCLQELVRVMDAYADIGTASAQLHYADGEPQRSEGPFLTLWLLLVPSFLREPLGLPRSRPSGSVDGVRDVDWVLGACQILRRETVEDVGPMDERIFMWYDDAEWCLRMAKAGWRRVVAQKAICIHHERRSAGELPRLRLNLQISMSEYTYFRLHHGRLKTGIIWLVRTLYSAGKVLVLAPMALLSAGRVGIVLQLLGLNWGRLRFHVCHAADILWREPRPYRADDIG